MACDSPYYVLPKAGTEKVPVSCGKCPPCKLRRVNSWVFRLMQEEKISTSAYFVTLTYDPLFVPMSENNFMTLRKKDLQDYFKRLRKLCPDSVVKYYATGEYGSKNYRPHYHLIVFNVPDPQMFFDAWSLNGTHLGEVHVGTVTSDSVAYTLKYLDKQTFTKKHGRDDRLPEFSLMSKGLGKNYLSKEVVSFHRSDMSKLYITKQSGHRIPLPKYYREKIFSEKERKLQSRIVADAVAKEESKARLLFKGDYDKYVEGQKYARHARFYHISKQNRLL